MHDCLGTLLNKVLLEVAKSRVLRTAGLLWALNLVAMLINNIKAFRGKKKSLCRTYLQQSQKFRSICGCFYLVLTLP